MHNRDMQVMLWDFGDGNSSANKDAEHIYNAAGTYNASVEITNGCGASTTYSFNGEYC